MPPPPPLPTASLTASPTSIASGASSTLTWSSNNASSCVASGAWSGSKAIAGSQSTGALTASKTYSLSCTGSGGSAGASTTVTVSGTPPPPPPPPVVLVDNIPDFSADSVHAMVQSAQSGLWSDPATWGGSVPGFGNVAKIGQGHTVTINDANASAYTVSVNGKLAFSPSVNTSLRVTNLQVLSTGVVEVGTAATPIDANVTAQIVIANSPFGSGVADPDQFGTGIIVLGKLSMYGSVKTPTFVRLGAEPHASDPSLTLSSAVTGWRVGDRIVLPDTRHIKESEVTPANGWRNAVNQWEERTVQAINGTTLTLNAALTYDHLGARNQDGVLELLPHVGNLTRNVVVRSESATGTRGHMMGTQRADVDIRYALFKDMGRTTYLPLDPTANHIGRYAIHMHHLSGPSALPANVPQFTLLGNAVDGGTAETKFKWGITIHGSHYGLIQDNVVYNYNGASIATEDGSESFNVFDHNFALRGIGEPDEPGAAEPQDQARMAMGTEGVGFWFRGPNNYVRNNVAANFQNPTTEASYGFVLQFRKLGGIAVPNSKGVDVTDSNQLTAVDGNNLPLLQFENNEAYGAMQGGMTYWWINSLDPSAPYTNVVESVVKNFTAWHVYNKGVYIYPGTKVTFDGLKIRGNYEDGVSRCCGDGVFFADYMAKSIVIRNSDIQGMQEGIIAPEAGHGTDPNLTIENSFLRNLQNVNVPIVGSVNGCWMDDKLVVINNTNFAAPPGKPLRTIAMVGDVANVSFQCPSKLNEVRVYSYNGNVNDNFQVYNPNWAPSAPCSGTRPEIGGTVCSIAPLAALSAPTMLARAGVELAQSGLYRIQGAMRRLYSTPIEIPPSAMVCRAALEIPPSAMVCRAAPLS